MSFENLKSRAAAVVLAAVLFSGCKKAPTDAEAMRAGISQHLAALRTLNISAMQLDIDNITYQGSQAHVQVTFRPKTGGPPGAGMQVGYLMEKRDSGWSVVKTESVGGVISHPPEGANPHTEAGQPNANGTMPNFRDLVSTSGAPGSRGTEGLPPGHPPLDSGSRQK